MMHALKVKLNAYCYYYLMELMLLLRTIKGETAADKIEPDDSNRATILHLIEEAKKGNVVHHNRHVLMI